MRQLRFIVSSCTSEDPSRAAANLENSEEITCGWQSEEFIFVFVFEET